MRFFVIIIGILLLAASVAFMAYQFRREPDLTRSPGPGTTIGVEGGLKLPPEQVQAAINEANTEIDSRLSTAATLRFWSRAASWTGFVLTSFMTVLVGFYGGRSEPGGDAAAALDRVLKEQQRSRALLRVAGALIAVATLPNLFAQRLEADTNNYVSSARSLQEVLIDSSSKMYDKGLSETEQAIALGKLKAATKVKW